jgi:hypothetical protein
MILFIGVSPPETSGIGRIAHETRLAESAVQAIPAAEGAGAALYLGDGLRIVASAIRPC